MSIFHRHKRGKWEKKTYIVSSWRRPEKREKLYQDRTCDKCGLVESVAM